MIKYIYKITNKINNKSYIGQTKDLSRRFSEHQRLGNGNENTKVLYQAFQKYGLDNFTFEVIEETEDYNEREKYWIKFYNTYLGEKKSQGYNMTPGGDEPPLLKGLDNFNTTHTIEQVNKVKYLLKETDLSNIEIGRLTNYDESSVHRINIGEMWFDNNENYPLRKMSTLKEHYQLAQQIINDLKNTNLTQKEIAKKYNIARTTVTAINQGQNCRQENEKYPIRSKKVIKTPYQEIINDLLNSDLKSSDIAKKYKVSPSLVCDINKGRKYKDENINYPLRQ